MVALAARAIPTQVLSRMANQWGMCASKRHANAGLEGIFEAFLGRLFMDVPGRLPLADAAEQFHLSRK